MTLGMDRSGLARFCQGNLENVIDMEKEVNVKVQESRDRDGNIKMNSMGLPIMEVRFVNPLRKAVQKTTHNVQDKLSELNLEPVLISIQERGMTTPKKVVNVVSNKGFDEGFTANDIPF